MTQQAGQRNLSGDARYVADTISGSAEYRAAPAVEVDREVHIVNDTLEVSAIPENWILRSSMTRFQDCWDVRPFKAMFSDV